MLLATQAAWAQDIKIVALGDSLIQGYGLAQGDGFVPQMQAWLSENGTQAEIVNAGVSGDTTTGALARFDWALPPDADALIVSLGGNDILRAIDPDLARANLAEILQRAKERQMPVLLVGINVPSNYGAEYQTRFQAIYPELSEQFATFYYPDFLQALLDFEDRAKTYLTYFQNDGLHPNKDGVAIIVADMGPSIVALAQRARQAK